MENTLNEQMTIDHVVRILADGTVASGYQKGVYAPEIYCDYSGAFADAQILDEHERDMIANVESQGWALETGWTGQYSYNGVIMHASEFIGGRLEEHIRETPGYWVALAVEIHPNEDDPEYDNGNGESDAAGWVLAYRPDQAPQSGYTPCACRDCMDITMSSDTNNPELCELCDSAGCVAWTQGSPAVIAWECQRDDAYSDTVGDASTGHGDREYRSGH